ncbi:hypothetical protein [Oryza sativa Japonica Group]|uniref:Uncharacterized protein n=1 Tax=Oryza sativa subsp. japonica TaxID=39947 RepID=Q8S1E9_ORYSJ|nr:hypothetical protein [Oryza sativa Japonica Group]
MHMVVVRYSTAIRSRIICTLSDFVVEGFCSWHGTKDQLIRQSGVRQSGRGEKEETKKNVIGPPEAWTENPSTVMENAAHWVYQNP